ncbi:MAG TPA: MgtC/SapB family protein [Polyangiaceae bacterium]|nr:MgtC/SapB family protein [Polyangiaceae bacterium]
MIPTPTAAEIALRLALAALAAGLIGVDRTERGRAAGIRTTMLVGTAAAIAMLLAVQVLPVRGRASDSFVTMDPMRLPLGILSGMGFIGAATVVRRDDLVVGVTTAATLWFTSVMGLCFGAGQYVLGGLAFVFCFVVLSWMGRLEGRLEQEHRATLSLVLAAAAPSDDVLLERLRSAGLTPRSWSTTLARQGAARVVRCELRWRALPEQVVPPPVFQDLARVPGVSEARWER